MSSLVSHISSDWIKAANALMSAGDGRKRVVAYVESYEDVSFWRLLLSEFEDADHYFQIMLPSRTSLTKGKKSALRACIDGRALGEYMIACVDSDYDFLMGGSNPVSALVNENPYVLQTYTYAIENYQCWAGSLHQVCVQATLNDNRLFNFELFLESYSKVIYRLFIWNVLFYMKKIHNSYPMTEFNKDIRIRTVDLRCPERSLETLSEKTARKVAWLERRYPHLRQEADELRQELVKAGVTESCTYLFVQGHGLIQGVIMKILEPLCALLRGEREQEIARLARHSEQYRNELGAYRHALMPIEEALRKNTHYRDCALYGKMRSDVRSLFSSRVDESESVEKNE